MNTSLSEHSQETNSETITTKRLHSSRNIITSFKAKADAKRTRAERFADFITNKSGSTTFLLINGFWFVCWILLNTGVIPGVDPFDPFPFSFLTMIVSLEAIVLAIVVLISQNRAAAIDDLREEIDLQVNVITEHELTKLIELMKILLEKNGIDISQDPAIQEALHPLSVTKIEHSIERQIANNHQKR